MTAPCHARLGQQIAVFGFELEVVGLDAGYNNPPLLRTD